MTTPAQQTPEQYTGTSEEWELHRGYYVGNKVCHWFNNPTTGKRSLVAYECIRKRGHFRWPTRSINPKQSTDTSSNENAPYTQVGAQYWKVKPKGFGVNYWYDPNRPLHDRTGGAGGQGSSNHGGQLQYGQTQHGTQYGTQYGQTQYGLVHEFYDYSLRVVSYSLIVAHSNWRICAPNQFGRRSEQDAAALRYVTINPDRSSIPIPCIAPVLAATYWSKLKSQSNLSATTFTWVIPNQSPIKAPDEGKRLRWIPVATLARLLARRRRHAAQRGRLDAYARPLPRTRIDLDALRSVATPRASARTKPSPTAPSEVVHNAVPLVVGAARGLLGSAHSAVDSSAPTTGAVRADALAPARPTRPCAPLGRHDPGDRRASGGIAVDGLDADAPAGGLGAALAPFALDWRRVERTHCAHRLISRRSTVRPPALLGRDPDDEHHSTRPRTDSTRTRRVRTRRMVRARTPLVVPTRGTLLASRRLAVLTVPPDSWHRGNGRGAFDSGGKARAGWPVRRREGGDAREGRRVAGSALARSTWEGVRGWCGSGGDELEKTYLGCSKRSMHGGRGSSAASACVVAIGGSGWPTDRCRFRDTGIYLRMYTAAVWSLRILGHGLGDICPKRQAVAKFPTQTSKTVGPRILGRGGGSKGRKSFLSPVSDEAALYLTQSYAKWLFNHARGTHSLAWTSPDECVRQCVCALEALQGGVVDFADLDVDPAFSRAEVEVYVAPYAMMSVLTKLFVRALVRTGLEIAARDLQRALMHIDGRVRRLPSIADMSSHWEPRMLIPRHILRCVVARGWHWTDELGMALLGCLSRSGVPLQRHPSIRPAQNWAGNLASQVSPSGGQEARVKTEPEGAIIHRIDSTIPR
ncbi:hypothetical protein B0H10DRAFT_1950376 [Mycena sp. CBHHK59/15]|nr:hypothetical protein B0H10DRAFT_1950376 [Mycena sp. CBHHK59/15]